MRIVQVVHQFFPEHRAGTETYTYNLCKRLQANNDVYIFCREYGKPDQPIVIEDVNFDGIKIRKIYYNRPSDQIKSVINADIERAFAEYLDVIDPAVVHFQHLSGLSATLINVAKKRRIPVILTLADYWFICPRVQMIQRDLSFCDGPENGVRCLNCDSLLPGASDNDLRDEELFLSTDRTAPKPAYFVNLLKKLAPIEVRNYIKDLLGKNKQTDNQLFWIYCRFRYMRELLNTVDLLIAPSRFLKSIYEDAGVHGKKFIWSDYGIDAERFMNIRKEPSTVLRFSYFGTLVDHKGVHVLIKAFNSLSTPDATLKIYGTARYSPVYAARLKSIASNPRICFMGASENVADDFSATDVMIVPSLWHENSPLIIHESLAARIPVIASRVGGIPELIKDGENGLLYDPHDYKDLLAKISRIIDNPTLLASLRNNIKPLKTIEEDCANIIKIYESLIRPGGN